MLQTTIQPPAATALRRRPPRARFLAGLCAAARRGRTADIQSPGARGPGCPASNPPAPVPPPAVPSPLPPSEVPGAQQGASDVGKQLFPTAPKNPLAAPAAPPPTPAEGSGDTRGSIRTSRD